MARRIAGDEAASAVVERRRSGLLVIPMHPNRVVDADRRASLVEAADHRQNATGILALADQVEDSESTDSDDEKPSAPIPAKEKERLDKELDIYASTILYHEIISYWIAVSGPERPATPRCLHAAECSDCCAKRGFCRADNCLDFGERSGEKPDSQSINPSPIFSKWV